MRGMCLHYKVAIDMMVVVGVYIDDLLVTATMNAGVSWFLKAV